MSYTRHWRQDYFTATSKAIAHAEPQVRYMLSVQRVNGMLTTRKGYSLTSQERIAKEVIERLMCNYRLNWNEIATTMQISVEEVKAALHYDQAQLNEMAADGLFDMTESGIVMTTTGHPFVRNVAAALDPLMQNTDKKFSKPI